MTVVIPPPPPPPTPPVTSKGRSRRFALGAGLLAGVVAYVFTGRAGLSLIVGGISGTAVGLAHRSATRGLRTVVTDFANLRHGIPGGIPGGLAMPPSVGASDCVAAAVESARARGLDIATLPQVPRVTCAMENGKSVCRSASGAVQAVDCLPEIGSEFHDFAIQVERRLMREGAERVGNMAIPGGMVPAQPRVVNDPRYPAVAPDPNSAIGRVMANAADQGPSREPMIFGSREGRQ